MMETTEKRFLTSMLAAGGSQIGRTGLRLVADLTLARLVLPEGHGLFALAWSTVLIAGFVRDQGLPYELVRDPKQRYGSVLLWEIGSGTLITAALILGAPLFAGLHAELPSLLRVLALWVLLEGLAVVPRVYFERELQVTRLVGPEIGRGFLMAVTSISMAALGYGVWSFVIGELVASLVYMSVLWLRAWGHMPLELDPRPIPRLLRHSWLLFVIALLANSIPSIGRFMVEIVDTTSMVGQFDKAILWALRAQILIVPAIVRAVYPALVAYKPDHARFVGAFRLGTVAILSAEVLVAYFLFFNAEIVVLEILLGKNWGEAVHLIRILAFLPLAEPFNQLGGEMLKAYREDRMWLFIVLLNVGSLVSFGWLLSRSFGTEGIAWAHYLMLGHLVMAWRVYRICGSRFWKIAKEIAFTYLVPLPFFLMLSWIFPAASWGRFAASVVACTLIGLLMIRRFANPFRDFFFGHSIDGTPPDPGGE